MQEAGRNFYQTTSNVSRAKAAGKSRSRKINNQVNIVAFCGK